MGKYYTIPNHNAKFTNSFKERAANELQDVCRFFSLQDNQDLLDNYQARAVHVFSPVIREIIDREINRRKHLNEPEEKVIVVPVANVSMNILEKVVQLTHSGFADISKQPFSPQDFERALIGMQIDFLTDDSSKGRSSHCGPTVKEHINHPSRVININTGQQPTLAMSMVSADDYYPANCSATMLHESSKKGKGRPKKSPAPIDDSDSNSSDFVPKQKRARNHRGICKPNTEKTIWRCGFDCPGVIFLLLERTNRSPC